MSDINRYRIRITGIVQGVGFRPFIFNLAECYSLAGWVTNDSSGVLIEVEGEESRLQSFLEDIPIKNPPLSQIDSITTDVITPIDDGDFQIKITNRSQQVSTMISPDMSICEDCYREMMDSGDDRYLYPFINCTNCGPRFTIIQEMPYDRAYTTMADFEMCDQCQSEYDNPRNRRFHAQPNGCPDCGPQVYLTDSSGRLIEREQFDHLPSWVRPIKELVYYLKRGKLAAVKGLGGYHLVCNALDQRTVTLLRKRKQRPAKPLAVMMPNLEVVGKYCHLSSKEEELLTSPGRPIVLLEWKNKGEDGIAMGVAPSQSRLGVMLPYTPLHYLLFDDQLEVLVMTSGNISGEPIIYRDQRARELLADTADYFLFHNRKIVRPCDDSVVRVDDQPVQLRRSRGYAPGPIKIDGLETPILAAGGELKNVFGLGRGNQVFLSQHIGDLKNRNSLHHYRRMISEMEELFEIEPELVVYDLHPEYLSGKYVKERYSDKELMGVQHHHAHLASCMAEHGIKEQVIGFAFDGTGYGTDGKIWGGEVLVAQPGQFERYAHLKYLPLPGGDKAVEEVWRIGAAYLYRVFDDPEQIKDLSFINKQDQFQLDMIFQMVEEGLQTPMTSSMGRLFDAVAAIMDIRSKVSYEGQAAIELEEMAKGEIGQPYSYSIENEEPPFIINPLPMLHEIVGELEQDIELTTIARRFHGTIVVMAVELATHIRLLKGLDKVVISGGVFQNRLLSRELKKGLEEKGFQVYQHGKVPPNDGGLALGQIYIAANQRGDEECV